MKIRHSQLVYLCSIILVLLACTITSRNIPPDSELSDTTQSAENEPSSPSLPTVSPSSIINDDVVECILAYDTVYTAMGDTFDNFLLLNNKASADPEIMFDIVWESEMNSMLNELTIYADAIEAITWPYPEYKSINDEMKKAASETRLLVQSYRKLLSGDDAAGGEVINHITNMFEAISAVNDELAIIITQLY